MGGRNFKKVGDGRSARPSRTDPYIAWLMREVPRRPIQLANPPQLCGASVKSVLAKLSDAHRAAELALEREIRLIVRPYQFGEFVGELIGCPSAHLSCSALYIMHLSQGAEDMLYAGASGASAARHRLIWHLASGGTKMLMGQHVVRLHESWSKTWGDTGQCEPSYDALFNAMFGANRFIRELQPDDPDDYKAAAGLVARGAFDIVVVEVAPGDELLAHLFEQYVCAVAEALAGHLPPLNRRKIYAVEAYAEAGLKGQAGAISLEQYRVLRRVLIDLAADLQVDVKRPPLRRPDEDSPAVPVPQRSSSRRSLLARGGLKWA